MAPSSELVIPHDPHAGPVTSVKNLVLQFSIAQLQAHGHYEAYTKVIDAAVLSDLLARLGPGWVPVKYAIRHFEAVDRLQLSQEQIDQLGKTVGDRIQHTTLVSAAKRSREEGFDVWSSVGQLHRMWSRLYQGGSVQISKIGPTDQLISRRGYPMNRFRYYRLAQLGAFAAAYAALGTELTTREVLEVDTALDEVTFHVGWG
ncbi:MAG TPA: hypothetical protein VJV78_47920 [Polyangiales bacterium]|nr:hypothetical protein [Polyangiales bacterium]